MPMEKGTLDAGMTLVAMYKRERYTADVVTGEKGLEFVLDGKTYNSPSSAGSAVMGGNACNGWRFWSIEGQEPDKKGREPKATAKTRKTKDGKKMLRQVKKNPNQKGAPEGQVRYHCSSCMKAFFVDEGTDVTECPEGHPTEVVDELAPPTGTSTKEEAAE